MSAFGIRQSKFRHVFGQASRKEGCYEGFKVTNCAFEGTFIAANKKFIAACTETGGGGAFIVLPVSKTGRLEVNLPKVSGHREYILDMQWNPYNDNMLATCSEDGSIKIWDIPDYGLVTNIDDSKALLVLEYHERRCVQIAWHPIVSNVILSVSQEPKVCVWNLDEGVAEIEITAHPDIIWNASWSQKGDKIVTSCKDKKFRIFDARSGECLVENSGHEGSKPQRVIFTFNDKYLFSTGFSKMSERQYACWDASDISELNLAEIDTANGCCIPYYDADTQMVYIAAKGDSVIRYYELVDEEPYFHYISTFQANKPQRGLACIQKRSVNVNLNEVFKFYKLIQGSGNVGNIGVIEPVSFVVPRKSELYQEDIYPDAISDKSAIEAAAWFEGSDAEPNRVVMKTFFEGKKSGTKTGGGLKKGGGLKGLKAKKDEKKSPKSEAPKAASTPAPSAATSEPAKPKETKPVVKEVQEPEIKAPTPSSIAKRESSKDKVKESRSSSSAADPKAVKDLQDEIKTLKDNEKNMSKEISSLKDKLKDYDKLTGDLKLLCDAVKKNDERIASLEALVQEESDNENGGDE